MKPVRKAALVVLALVMLAPVPALAVQWANSSNWSTNFVQSPTFTLNAQDPAAQLGASTGSSDGFLHLTMGDYNSPSFFGFRYGEGTLTATAQRDLVLNGAPADLLIDFSYQTAFFNGTQTRFEAIVGNLTPYNFPGGNAGTLTIPAADLASLGTGTQTLQIVIQYDVPPGAVFLQQKGWNNFDQGADRSPYFFTFSGG